MKDSLNTLKELASSVRNATKEGENSAERIGRLFEGILEYIKTPESIENYFELKQDSNGLDYIYTKYNIASAGALSMYASDKINVPSIYDGLPIDNDTIYWHEVDGSKVLKAKGGGGEAGSVQWDNISGKPSWIEDTKPSYSWSDITGEKPFYTKEEIASKYVTIDTEQEITALKHFTAGLSVGESKKKIYEENGVVYIDADVAVTGGMTFYATAGRSVSTIMDAVAVDGITIKKENNVLKAVAGAGSSFDENAMWVALATSDSEKQIDKSHITTALTGFATESWVSGKNYAVKATTLAGYGITDGINAVSVTGTGNAVTAASISGHTLTLTKGSTFSLSGHKHAWSDITSGKPSTLSGYGITDAYTKTESDSKYPTKTGSGASGTWGINVTGNAGTATKLQTARSLWGNNFDGSSNVSGQISLGSNGIYWKETNFGDQFKIIPNFANTDDNNKLLIQSAVGGAGTTPTLTTKVVITGKSGNVGIGVDSPSTKLHVMGDILSSANVRATDSVYINGIRLHKTADGVITLEGNLAVTGGITTYAIDPVSASTVMDGVVVDGTTIKKENGKLVAVGGGEAGSVAWGNISGKPSVFATNIANITDLHSSWDSVLAAQKPAWLTAVSIATISDLNSGWDALLKAAPSAYVTRWPTISEVTGKQNLIVKLNGGTTEGTNQFTYNVTGAKTINITPAGIGAAASSHNHSWSQITSGKPTTLAGYGITDAYTKTESDNRYLNVSGGDTIQGLITINHTTLDNSINIVREGSNNPTICFSNKTNGQLGRIGFNNEGKVCIYFKTSSDESYVWHSTNDGAGSGLDADLLDGTHKSGLLTALTSSSGTNISITVGGTTKSIADLYANSAYKLENTHTIWGQNFNGTQNITGRFTSNERVYADKGIWVTNNDIAGWEQSNAALNLSIPNTSNTSGIICVYRSGQSNIGYTRFFSMEISNSSDSVRTYYANEVRIDITPTYMDINKQLNINGNTIIGSGGNLGIGTANPAAKLHVIGDILATGGGTYYGSDVRYKSIMQQVELSLLSIAEAPSFVYRWNRPNMNQNRLNLGGSAQYTQSILPWAVENSNNFLSMDYATVAYTFAVHTARHLLTYETRTDKKIKKLEREIVILKKQLKKLGYEEVRTLDDQSV